MAQSFREHTIDGQKIALFGIEMAWLGAAEVPVITSRSCGHCMTLWIHQELQTLAGRVAMFLGCLRNYTTSSPEISPAFLLLLGLD
jgi:hypothetical protein